MGNSNNCPMPWVCTGTLCSASGWEQPRNDLSAHTLVDTGGCQSVVLPQHQVWVVWPWVGLLPLAEHSFLGGWLSTVRWWQLSLYLYLGFQFFISKVFTLEDHTPQCHPQYFSSCFNSIFLELFLYSSSQYYSALYTHLLRGT